MGNFDNLAKYFSLNWIWLILSISLTIFLWYLFSLTFSILLSLGVLFIISFDFVCNKKLVLHLAYWLVIISVFLISFNTGHPFILATLIYLLLSYVNIVNPKNKKELNIQTRTVIILTIIVIDLTYPILKPRVEYSLGEVYKGEVEGDYQYGWRDVLISVTPPMINNNNRPICSNIVLGYDTKKVIMFEPIFGLDIRNGHGGLVNVCTFGFLDFIKRSTTIKMKAFYPLWDYFKENENLDRFYWFNQNKFDVRLSPIKFYNYNDRMPIYLSTNLSFYITNETHLDVKNKMLSELLNNKQEECKLNNFYLYGNKTRLRKIETIKINNEKIKLLVSLYSWVQPNSSLEFDIGYDTTLCKNAN